MTHKIDEDAFIYFVSLGQDRTYQQVADRYRCSKRAVQKVAHRESWIARLRRIEDKTRESMDEKLAHGLEEVRERHLKLVRAMLSRAAKAIHDHPLTSGMEGMRAAESAIKLERMILGEATERTTVTVERTTKQEMERFLFDDMNEADDDLDDDSDDLDDEDEAAPLEG